VTSGNIRPQCSHQAAVKLFTDSIKNKCVFTAFSCESYENFSTGDCLKCGAGGCNQMGYYASASADQDSLYLNTNEPSSEYVCKQYYQVSLESADFGAKQAKGYFTIYLVTASELSSTESLDSNNAVFESNSVHRRLVSVQAPLKSTEVVSAFITYKRGWNPLDYWWYENKWMFKKVQVLSADSQLKVNLCPVEEMLDEDASIKYVRC